MKTKSRVLSLLMAAVMILALLPVTGLAADYDGHWAAGYIEDARGRDWVNGYPDGTFRPDASITRGEFAVMLWRALGEPAAKGNSPFTDVAADAWYYDAVTALYEADVVSGYGNGTYGPNNRLTREMAFTMLARAFGLKPENAGDYTRFADYAAVSAWARESTSALTERGYVEGNGNQLMPKKILTRDEMAKLLIAVFDGSQSVDEDKTGPSIALSQSPVASTSGKVTVTVVAEDKSGISYIGWRSSSGGASYADKSGFQALQR